MDPGAAAGCQAKPDSNLTDQWTLKAIVAARSPDGGHDTAKERPVGQWNRAPEAYPTTPQKSWICALSRPDVNVAAGILLYIGFGFTSA
jgi:hypothetical protein